MDAQTPATALVIEHEPSREVTPFELLDRALKSGASTETLEKFMALQERHEANVARKAFNEAFSQFKAEAIKIVRNKTITDGPLKGRKYAELFSFVDAVTPALAANGLSHSWAVTRDEKDWIEVTCTLEHALGGSRKTSQGGPPDTGGAKNPLQARVSTVTYLEKATLKAACGLAEQGDDDDGKGGGPSNAAISAEQLAELEAFIDETDAEPSKILRKCRVESLGDIPARDFPGLMTSLRAWAAQQKAPAA